MGKYSDKNDCTYTGQIQNGIAHGHGEMVCPAKIAGTFQGEWYKGAFHGKGRYTWENGEYEGDF